MKLIRSSGSQVVAGKILVIFPGALGDFICFLPALERLARGGEVDLLARAEYADLLPATVAARSLERYEITRLFVPGAERDEGLRCFFGPYAFIYSWMGSGQPDFIRHLQILSNGKLGIFPFRPSRSRVHMADYYLSCLGEERSRWIFPTISLRSDAVAWSRRFWRQGGLQGKRVLALAPGSGAKGKNWPNRFYQAVADWWQGWIGGKVVVVMGPVEEDRREIENLRGGVQVVRGAELAKVAALLTRCDYYLGNDSGITHLAAALGVETVALFGPTDPVQWAPRGKRVTVVTRNVECSPCADSAMKACPHRRCLTEMSPGGVIGILEERSKRSPSAGKVSGKHQILRDLPAPLAHRPLSTGDGSASG